MCVAETSNQENITSSTSHTGEIDQEPRIGKVRSSVGFVHQQMHYRCTNDAVSDAIIMGSITVDISTFSRSLYYPLGGCCSSFRRLDEIEGWSSLISLGVPPPMAESGGISFSR